MYSGFNKLPCSADTSDDADFQEFLSDRSTLPEHTPETSPEIVVQKLHNHFLKWRRAVLTRMYLNGTGNGERCTGSGRTKYIREAGKYGAFYTSGVPNQQYFKEHILPTIMKMARNAEELEQIGKDAIETLEKLMVGGIAQTTHRTTHRLIHGFFEDKEIDEQHSYGGWGASTEGQFKYFYKNYGKWPTMAVAMHQGWECDKYYGGGDYTNSFRQLLLLFSPALRMVPEELMEPAFKAFVKYGGHSAAQTYMKEMPMIINEIRKERDEGYVADYFALAECAPQIDAQHHQSTGFPIIESEKVISELDALQELGEYKDAALSCARQAILSSSYSDIAPSFKKKDEKELYYGETLILPEVIEHLETSEYTPTQINTILRIPEKHPWLGKAGLEIVGCYPELEANFPGGVKGLIKYCRSIRNAPKCMRQLIYSCKEEGMPAANPEHFLETGKRAARQFGDDAYEYFIYRKRSIDNRFRMGHMKTLEAGREAFDALIDEAEKMALEFPNERGNVFVYLLRYADDPNFESMKKGLKILSDALQRYLKEHDDPDTIAIEYTFWKGYEKIFGQYANLLLGLRESDEPFALPAHINLENQARIVEHFCSRNGNPHCADDDVRNYKKLIELGFDYRVAARMRIRNNDDRLLVTEVHDIEGVDCPLSDEKMRSLSCAINGARAHIAALLECSPSQLQWESRRLNRSPQSQDLTEIDESGYEQLKEDLALLEQMEKDPDFKGLLDFTHLKIEVEQAMRIGFFKRMIGVSVHARSGHEVEKTPLMTSSNPSTQAAIAGMSLLSALGSANIPAGSTNIVRRNEGGTNIERILSGPLDELYGIQDLLTRDYLSTLTAGINRVLPAIEQRVRNARMETPGLMPIGAKIHTQKPMDPKILEFFMSTFGLTSTPFHLIHANHSLVLPPMPSALELKFLIHTLEKFGLIDSKNPDIQVAMAGRWDEELAPIVGASMLLGTNRGVRYAEGAFSTTHDTETGARIMAFDAGVKKDGLPFDLPNATGRTDMLGRHSYGDIDRYQMLGTLASHLQCGGEFAGHMEGYATDFLRLLDQHDLLPALRQSAWVYDHAKPDDSLQGHEGMVRAFSDTWMRDARMPDYGVIGEIGQMIQGVSQGIRDEKPRIIASNPGDYKRLLEY